MAERSRQPWLHRLQVAVHGNTTSLAHSSLDIDAGAPDGGATGLFVDDRRVLDRLVLRVDGLPPVPLVASSTGNVSEVLLLARNVGDVGPDPTVELRRRRTLRASGMTDGVVLTSRAAEAVDCTLTLTARGDGADLHDVKHGEPTGPALAVATTGPDGGDWRDERHHTTVTTNGAAVTVEGDALVARWPVSVAPGASVSAWLEVQATREVATPFDAQPGAARVDWSGVRVTSQDSRFGATVSASLRDLEHLLLADPLDEHDVFTAAGSPWYLTLFGRDSIWSARMALPFGTDLARGTLRALGRRQGSRHDVAAAEEPGKILHEVRRATFSKPGEFELPPLYYGTVDATPLWVCLLHDAWRWGLDASDVLALRPTLESALDWIRRSVDDGDGGFLRYLDVAGTGLTNQGWKDSGDSMRTASGAVATGSIALVETQAYAVEAALGAATLLDEVLDGDGEPWRRWAADLAARVRERFWVGGTDGRFLAMALDGEGAPVDGIGSNMGHALGSGLLDEAEAALVAATLAAPGMLGPLGVRTLSSGNPAYNPVGYHTGSVWTHDTAICAHGLARTGHHDVAARCISALVDVAAASDYRWPELFGADPVGGAPAPYPASCRPQAWAAASSGVLVSTVLGLRADVPHGLLELAPLPESPFGAVRVEGLRLGARPLAVEVDNAGRVVDVEAPDGIEVVVRRPGD